MVSGVDASIRSTAFKVCFHIQLAALQCGAPAGADLPPGRVTRLFESGGTGVINNWHTRPDPSFSNVNLVPSESVNPNQNVRSAWYTLGGSSPTTARQLAGINFSDTVFDPHQAFYDVASRVTRFDLVIPSTR